MLMYLRSCPRRNMLLSSKVLTFMFGTFIGASIYYVLFVKHQPKDLEGIRSELGSDVYLEQNAEALEQAKLFELYSASKINFVNRPESAILYDLTKVNCVIFVENPRNAYLIYNTWGRKCNTLNFFSKVKDNFIEATVINVKNKWQYFCESLRYLRKHNKDLQWVIFSPDDVYVIPENLRYFVATKDSRIPYYFGHNVEFWQQKYNSGKTSFVLSLGAIESLMNKFNSSLACASSKITMNSAAYNLGKHLSSLGISAGDSYDHLGRERFHIFTFEQLMPSGDSRLVAKYSKTSSRPVKQGKECCSRTSVSFRSVQNDQIYFFHYLFYTVKAMTSVTSFEKKKIPTADDQVWKDFVIKTLGNVDLSTITKEKYYDLWISKVMKPKEFYRMIRENIMQKFQTLVT